MFVLLSYRKNFVGTQKRVRISHGKRAISVRTIEIRLYMDCQVAFIIIPRALCNFNESYCYGIMCLTIIESLTLHISKYFSLSIAKDKNNAALQRQLQRPELCR